MRETAKIRQMIGMADSCELMALTFVFPDESLAAALASGAYGSDALDCLSDAGADEKTLARVRSALHVFVDVDVDALLVRMKRGYSLLYLAPEPDGRIWTYEAPFRYVAQNKAGAPSLFRSPTTLDVEACMRKAGVTVDDNRKEPADSIRNEFLFLSHLHKNLALALIAEDDSDARKWTLAIESFAEKHILIWLVPFMELTRDRAELIQCAEEYVALSIVGSALGAILSKTA